MGKTRSKLMKEYLKDNVVNLAISNEDSLELIEHYFKENGYDLERAMEVGSIRAEQILRERELRGVKIILYENPMKTDRPRTGKFGNMYSNNAEVNWKYMKKVIKEWGKRIGQASDLINGMLISTPAEIYIRAYFEPPKVRKKDAHEILLMITNIIKVLRDPDYDNIGKCYTDMLNKNLIVDDRLFYKGTIVKLYSLIPRVEITVIYQSKHDSYTLYDKFSKNKSVKEMVEDDLIRLEYLEE
jgi:Holliday junction resolvase RusA-like endonuclease